MSTRHAHSSSPWLCTLRFGLLAPVPYHTLPAPLLVCPVCSPCCQALYLAQMGLSGVELQAGSRKDLMSINYTKQARLNWMAQGLN